MLRNTKIAPYYFKSLGEKVAVLLGKEDIGSESVQIAGGVTSHTYISASIDIRLGK